MLDDTQKLAGMTDAALEVYSAYLVYQNAKDPIRQAFALADLHNTMFDLSTWLPGYNVETGEVDSEFDN